MRSAGTLTDPQRWQHHAYDYGFRKHVLHDENRRSPVDPEGRWFAPPLVDQALAWQQAGRP